MVLGAITNAEIVALWDSVSLSSLKVGDLVIDHLIYAHSIVGSIQIKVCIIPFNQHILADVITPQVLHEIYI